MRVRSFRLSDCLQVTQLFETVLSNECYDETMEAFARQLSMDSGLIMVAEDSDNNILGVIIGTIDHNHAYYYRIAVHPDHQRKGIGKLLVQRLKDRFELRKVRRIFVSVDRHNENILPLYESAGYDASDFMHSVQNLQIVCG